MTSGPSDLLAKVIGHQDATNPKELLKRVNLELEDEGQDQLAVGEIAELIITARENEPLHSKFYVQLGQWMTEKSLRPVSDDEVPTDPNSAERRVQIHRRLGLPNQRTRISSRHILIRFAAGLISSNRTSRGISGTRGRIRRPSIGTNTSRCSETKISMTMRLKTSTRQPPRLSAAR